MLEWMLQWRSNTRFSQTFEFMRVLNSDGGDVCWSDFQGVIEQIEFDLYNSIETNDVMLDDTY